MSDERPAEVNAPTFKRHLAEDDDEWRVHLYNQERFLATQDRMSELMEKQMEQAVDLNTHLETLSAVMKDSNSTAKSMVANVVQVPIAIGIIGMASWAFYEGRIQEWTWIVIMAVCSFKYIGDSITAVVKLLRGKTNGN